MTDRMEMPEIQERPDESREVSETAADIDRATFEPEVAVELDQDRHDAEAIDAALVESMAEKTLEASTAAGEILMDRGDSSEGVPMESAQLGEVRGFYQAEKDAGVDYEAMSAAVDGSSASSDTGSRSDGPIAGVSGIGAVAADVESEASRNTPGSFATYESNGSTPAPEGVWEFDSDGVVSTSAFAERLSQEEQGGAGARQPGQDQSPPSLESDAGAEGTSQRPADSMVTPVLDEDRESAALGSESDTGINDSSAAKAVGLGPPPGQTLPLDDGGEATSNDVSDSSTESAGATPDESTNELPPPPDPEDYIVGTDDDGNPVYNLDAYNADMQEWEALKVATENEEYVGDAQIEPADNREDSEPPLDDLSIAAVGLGLEKGLVQEDRSFTPRDPSEAAGASLQGASRASEVPATSDVEKKEFGDTIGEIRNAPSSQSIQDGNPTVPDINQANLGDVYLLAKLAELGVANPSSIAGAIDESSGEPGARAYQLGDGQLTIGFEGSMVGKTGVAGDGNLAPPNTEDLLSAFTSLNAADPGESPLDPEDLPNQAESAVDASEGDLEARLLNLEETVRILQGDIAMFQSFIAQNPSNGTSTLTYHTLAEDADGFYHLHSLDMPMNNTVAANLMLDMQMEVAQLLVEIAQLQNEIGNETGGGTSDSLSDTSRQAQEATSESGTDNGESDVAPSPSAGGDAQQAG